MQIFILVHELLSLHLLMTQLVTRGSGNIVIEYEKVLALANGPPKFSLRFFQGPFGRFCELAPRDHIENLALRIDMGCIHVLSALLICPCETKPKCRAVACFVQFLCVPSGQAPLYVVAGWLVVEAFCIEGRGRHVTMKASA